MFFAPFLFNSHLLSTQTEALFVANMEQKRRIKSAVLFRNSEGGLVFNADNDVMCICEGLGFLQSYSEHYILCKSLVSIDPFET